MKLERVEILFDLPVGRTFTYAVPESLAGQLSPGHRVWAPFRGRPRLGLVAGPSRADLGIPVKAIERMAEPEPLATPELLELARWASGQWLASWGEVAVKPLPKAPSARSRWGDPLESPCEVSVSTGISLPEPLAKSLETPGLPILVLGQPSPDLLGAAGRDLKAEGRGLLVIAPELESADRLSSQMTAVGLPHVRLDSGQPDRTRWQGWRGLASGRSLIAVGSRSALWAPMPHLGLIFLAEEEHPAHKSPERPRVHARDLAVERALREDAACWLVSRVPSLEAYSRVQAGLYRLHHLPASTRWPEVETIDLRGASSPLTYPLLKAIRTAIGSGSSVLLLLNRRGYSALLCRECGYLSRCEECGLSLAFSPVLRNLTCRLCTRRGQAPDRCPECRGTRLSPFGWSIERIEAEIRRRFPRVGIARFEEATTKRGQRARLLEALNAGAIRILVGTYHVAKALPASHSPLLALLSTDGFLTIPDFRAGERTFQRLWGLAEEVGARGGRLLLQSHYPEHPVFQAVLKRDRSLFYREELALRRELAYPPVSRLVRLFIRNRDREHCRAFATTLAGLLRAGGHYRQVYGPTPVGGGVQLLVKGEENVPTLLAGDLEKALAGRRSARVSVEVDVDPIEFS